MGMEARVYIGWETPLSPVGGPQDPLPPHTPGQGPFCKFKKKYIKVLSPLGRATGVYFRNFFETDIYFCNFDFFLNMKKKKPPSRRGVAVQKKWRRRRDRERGTGEENRSLLPVREFSDALAIIEFHVVFGIPR